MAKLQGHYTVLIDNVEVANFPNLITSTGQAYWLQGDGTAVRTAVLSSDTSEPSLSSTEIKEDLVLYYQDQEDGYKDREDPRFTFSFSRLRYTGTFFGADLEVSKVGVKFANVLFSEALIRDSKGAPATLMIKSGQNVTVIYELKLSQSKQLIEFEDSLATLVRKGVIGLETTVDESYLMDVASPVELLPVYRAPNRISYSSWHVDVERNIPEQKITYTVKFQDDEGFPVGPFYIGLNKGVYTIIALTEDKTDEDGNSLHKPRQMCHWVEKYYDWDLNRELPPYQDLVCEDLPLQDRRNFYVKFSVQYRFN